MLIEPKSSTHAGLDAALQQLKALADPTRLRIIIFLASGERCACDLGDAVATSANLLSHHLKVLREADLIEGTRRGRWIDYRLRPETLAALERRFAGLTAETTRMAPRSSRRSPEALG